MKNPLTPAGIEPATFRIVAQHLNHCATAVPKCSMCRDEIFNPAVAKPAVITRNGAPQLDLSYGLIEED